MEKKTGAKAMDGGAAKSVKKPRTIWKAPMVNKEQQQDEGQDPKTLHVSLELDALECPVCFSPFEAAIFQCKNGHAACESCCARMQQKCSCCREPIGDIRCRPLEKAIAAMLVPCAFAKHGCTERLRLPERRTHEALLCQHAPCACPVPGCAYSGSGPKLRDHILQGHAAAGIDGDAIVVSFIRSTTVTLHRGTPFRVLVKHGIDVGVFLLLNGGDVPSGRSLSVVSVGSRPAGNAALEYKLEVSAGGGPGGLSLSASGPVPFTRRWAGHHPTEGFLFVPDAYWSSSGSVSVTVTVRKLAVDKAV
ncbi:hypothetical protein ACP70R_030360 [Stipagrostis hirtigluma subsp. patula]